MHPGLSKFNGRRINGTHYFLLYWLQDDGVLLSQKTLVIGILVREHIKVASSIARYQIMPHIKCHVKLINIGQDMFNFVHLNL